MDIPEKLFGLSWRAQKNFMKPKIHENAVYLNDEKEHLMTVAGAFFGEIKHIKPVDGCGGIAGSSFFLPEYFDLFDEVPLNRMFYVYRILLDQTATSLGFTFKQEVLSETDLLVISLCAYRTVLAELVKIYPNLSPYVSQLTREFRENKSKTSNIFYRRSLQEQAVDEIQSILSGGKASSMSLFIEAISPIILNENYDEKSLIVAAVDFKKIMKRFNIDFSSSRNLKVAKIFLNIPTNAQILKIKNSAKSKITSSESDRAETLKETKAKERIKKIELDEDDPDCNPASMLMEAVKTADIFNGGKKMVDGADELDDQFEALEELNVRELTRSSTQTKSIFKADTSMVVEYEDSDNDITAPTGLQFSYDEWNVKSKGYRKSWCTVNQKFIEMPEDQKIFLEYYDLLVKKNHEVIQELKKVLTTVLFDKRSKKRQIDGFDIDIDALINARVDLKAGQSPSNNLYISKKKTPDEFAVCFLIDSSLSSDSYVNGEKIIDIIKESLFVLQEAIDGLFHNLMIATFYSNTRKNTSFNIVKNFDETWSHVKSRSINIVPTGYTRIGGALRHSIHCLEKSKSKNKVIILLSDGKPTDYDAYEGVYGISDVRQCVREANANDIEILSLAIDKNAKFYFPQLFGANNYQVISSPKTMPNQLVKLFARFLK
jgi:nitric oxide reductase NorD protein